MLATLLTRRWLTATALAVAFAVAAALLGAWQWSRHEEKVADRDRVEAHYGADPTPLAEAVPDGRVGAEDEWLRVRARGRYLTEERLLVRNRPHHGVYGYEVLVPLQVDGSDLTLLVDRGWVPNAPDATTLPDVPPAPDGELTVQGWLRPAETALGRELPAGQLASIDPAAAEAATGLSLVDGYLVLEQERPEEGAAGSEPAPPRPEPLEPPRTELGTHLAYAIQWWLTAPVGLVLVGVLARREHREATGAARTDPDRPRRRWIWDEEDE